MMRDKFYEPKLLTFRSDFEKAAMNGVCKVFPDTKLDGCFFHFAQANFRQVSTSGLAGMYRSDPELALHCKMFTALAFLPVERVLSAFDELKELAPKTQPLWGYFQNTYIGHFEAVGDPQLSRRMATVYAFKKPLFDTEIWNVRERVLADEPKTTNSLEAWHRRFQIIIGKSHPNIYEFITKLKSEQSYTDFRLDKIYAGEDPIKIKRKAKTQTQRLKTVVQKYDDYLTVFEYLRGCARNFEFIP
jgi:hypothetical protein